MTTAQEAVAALLPMRVERAEFEDPTLLVGGSEWSLSATCAWRWVNKNGHVVSPAEADPADRIWELIGNEIISVTWSGPPQLGLDPSFELRSGGFLDVFSDAPFDTWFMTTPTLGLVGPLRAG
jgi:hypothetical protein